MVLVARPESRGSWYNVYTDLPVRTSVGRGPTFLRCTQQYVQGND